MCDGLILHLNPFSGCPLWPIFASLPCNCSIGQTPVIFLLTIISHFTGDLYPVGLLAFENAAQISHILEKPSKNLTWSQEGALGEVNDRSGDCTKWSPPPMP